MKEHDGSCEGRIPLFLPPPLCTPFEHKKVIPTFSRIMVEYGTKLIVIPERRMYIDTTFNVRPEILFTDEHFALCSLGFPGDGEYDKCRFLVKDI